LIPPGTAGAVKLAASADLFRVVRTAKSMSLPIHHSLFEEPLVLLEALNDTMKHRNGAQNLPVPKGIGDPIFVNDLTFDEIKNAAATFKNLGRDLAARAA
jgi:3-dehydroquinate synthase